MSPRGPSLRVLRAEAADCQRCPLFARATQTVFGEGARGGIMLVGEQPGDVEDRAGKPFVGPAGRLLRELLAEAGIPEDEVYVTNAVKHFKWRPKGTRRIHDKPSWSEVQACGHWLGLELAAVRPALVVALGATAAQALLGRTARVGALRGRPLEIEDGVPAIVTMHPSAVLRADADREVRRAELRADLELARKTAPMTVATSPQRSKIAKS
jgi:uracil-DNA glycosylase family protein